MKLISRLLPAVLFYVALPCAVSSAQDTCTSVCGSGNASCNAVCWINGGGGYSTCGEQGYDCCPRYSRSVIDQRLVTIEDYDPCPGPQRFVTQQQWVLYEDECGLEPEQWVCVFGGYCYEFVNWPEPAWCPYCGGGECPA